MRLKNFRDGPRLHVEIFIADFFEPIEVLRKKDTASTTKKGVSCMKMSADSGRSVFGSTRAQIRQERRSGGNRNAR